MSTFQTRINSPQGRQTCSPKQTPSKCLSPQTSSYPSKIQQKGKSPPANKEKKSPTKKVTKIQNENKLTDLLVHVGNKNNGHHHHVSSSNSKEPKKTHQSSKDDKQKIRQGSENALPFDNRVENKIRRSDHHIMVPPNDSVPYKQKSHSVKSVCVPQELLLTSPQACEAKLNAQLNKKIQTTKHSNLQEVDLESIYNMDLLALYKKHIEENYGEEGFYNKVNKLLPGTKQKTETDYTQKTIDNHSIAWPETKSVQKDSLQNYENINQLQTPSKAPLMFPGTPWSEKEDRVNYKYNPAIPEESREKEPKRVNRKLNTPETSPPSRLHKDGKKKTKASPRPGELTGGVSHNTKSQKVDFQEIQKMKNNYMQELYKDLQKPEGGREQIHSNSLFLPKDLRTEQSTKSGYYKGPENRIRTGSVQNEVKEVIYDTLNDDQRYLTRSKLAKHSNPNIYNDANNDYMNLHMNGNGKIRGDSQARETQPLQEGNEGYVLSTRSALERQVGNAHTEGNEIHYGQGQMSQSYKFNKDVLVTHTKIDEREEDDDKANQIMKELLKGNALKELKVNPNAKFLLLRKQVQEKRNKTGFKSADWNANEQNNLRQTENILTSPTKENASPSRSPIYARSPNVVRSPDESRSPQRALKGVDNNEKDMDESVTKKELFQLFSRTKNILASYKNKEQNWERERTLFIGEIKRLRGLVKKGWNK